MIRQFINKKMHYDSLNPTIVVKINNKFTTLATIEHIVPIVNYVPIVVNSKIKNSFVALSCSSTTINTLP